MALWSRRTFIPRPPNAPVDVARVVIVDSTGLVEEHGLQMLSRKKACLVRDINLLDREIFVLDVAYDSFGDELKAT